MQIESDMFKFYNMYLLISFVLYLVANLRVRAKLAYNEYLAFGLRVNIDGQTLYVRKTDNLYCGIVLNNVGGATYPLRATCRAAAADLEPHIDVSFEVAVMYAALLHFVAAGIWLLIETLMKL